MSNKLFITPKSYSSFEKYYMATNNLSYKFIILLLNIFFLIYYSIENLRPKNGTVHCVKFNQHCC